jgi:hypothetical protein
MKKIYDPAPGVAYIIYLYNKKGKKQLYSACGKINNIKDYCIKNGISFNSCKDNTVCGCHYLEVKR